MGKECLRFSAVLSTSCGLFLYGVTEEKGWLLNNVCSVTSALQPAASSAHCVTSAGNWLFINIILETLSHLELTYGPILLSFIFWNPLMILSSIDVIDTCQQSSRHLLILLSSQAGIMSHAWRRHRQWTFPPSLLCLHIVQLVHLPYRTILNWCVTPVIGFVSSRLHISSVRTGSCSLP